MYNLHFRATILNALGMTVNLPSSCGSACKEPGHWKPRFNLYSLPYEMVLHVDIVGEMVPNGKLLVEIDSLMK